MSVSRRLFILFLFAASLLSTSCAEPPDKEMQQAEGAIAAARAAGAEQYATEEFSASVNALKRAHDAVNDHDYRLALNHALESRERAENAAKLGSDAKAAARANAEHEIATLSNSLDLADAQLKTLEASRATAKAAADLRRRLAIAHTDVQKARTALDGGDYKSAAAAAAAGTQALPSVPRATDTGSSAADRRRR